MNRNYLVVLSTIVLATQSCSVSGVRCITMVDERSRPVSDLTVVPIVTKSTSLSVGPDGQGFGSGGGTYVAKPFAWSSGDITIMGLPLYHIAMGPDIESGQVRGHAKGIIAIGDIATGWLAIGGLARGIIAIGGCALGLVALGGLAIGGGAFGIVALGGGAVGYYACGGGAFGAHVLSGMRQDSEMLDLLK